MATVEPAILSAVTSVIAAASGRPVEGLGADTLIEDLPLDSMALVEALFTLEERFDVTIPFQAAAAGQGGGIATLGELARQIGALRSVPGRAV